MKSLRLNQNIRDSIVNNIMSKWVESNPEPETDLPDFEACGNILAMELWDKVYGKYTSYEIPEDLFNNSHYIKVQFPNESISNLEYKEINERGLWEKLYKMSTRKSKVEYVLTVDDPLYIKYKKNVSAYKEINKKMKKYKTEMNNYKEGVIQVISGVNTTGQLLEVWPEVVDFIPEGLNNPSKINLPSVNISQLNDQLK